MMGSGSFWQDFGRLFRPTDGVMAEVGIEGAWRLVNRWMDWSVWILRFVVVCQLVSLCFRF